jgi:flagellin-like protein
MKKRENSHFEFLFNKNILNSKRSQSGIITTILTILIIFVAVAIVWNIVKSTINTNTEDALIGQFAIDLEINSVYIAEDNQEAYVSVERGVGEGEISALYFIFTGSSYTYKYPFQPGGIPSQLESKIYNISASAVQAQNPGFSNFASIKSVSIALDIASSGKTVTTPIKSVFKEDLKSDANLPNEPGCCVPPYIEAGGCTDGEKRQCGVTEIGPCQFGNETCSGGIWGSCIGSINPIVETCNNVDDNCNGAIDDGVTQLCGTDVGECQSGNQICSAGVWGSCIGSIGPVNESLANGNCVDLKDNDCDSLIDTDPECSGSCAGTNISCGIFPSCTNCNLLDGTCSGNYSRDYFCSGTSCSYNSNLCTDCTCTCGGFGITELPANGNCYDGKNNDCDANQDCNDNGCYGYSTCCSNGVKDGNEVGIDCGGSCSPCAGGTNYTVRSCNVYGSASPTGVKCNAGSFYRREDYTNATYGNCADGTSNSTISYINNIYVNATTVLTTDAVNINCETYCYTGNATEYAILYNNGSGWRNMVYANCIAASSGLKNLTTNIPIDNVAGTHYFRCWATYSGCSVANTCCGGSTSQYGDNDDMKITVI